MPAIIENPAPDTIIAGRRLEAYLPIEGFPGHHHNNNMIVGYAVRETVRGGKILWHDADCGYDVAVVEGSTNYADTFEIRDRIRFTPGGYAVVDRLYSCGCRS